MSDDRIVAGSLFHDAGPATANARSPNCSSNVEPGDRRVLPSGVENEQRLLSFISLLPSFSWESHPLKQAMSSEGEL